MTGKSQTEALDVLTKQQWGQYIKAEVCSDFVTK